MAHMALNLPQSGNLRHPLEGERHSALDCEVVEMVDCMICGTITLTDSLFFTDSYVLPRMTDLFYINMAWMMHQQNTGSVTGGIPSLATLREDVLPEMYRI